MLLSSLVDTMVDAVSVYSVKHIKSKRGRLAYQHFIEKYEMNKPSFYPDSTFIVRSRVHLLGTKVGVEHEKKEFSIFFDPIPYFSLAYYEILDILNSVETRFIEGSKGLQYDENIINKLVNKNRKYLRNKI